MSTVKDLLTSDTMIPELFELIDGAITCVPKPSTEYYLNYFLHTVTSTTTIISSHYLGPYPETLAEFLEEHYLHTLSQPSNAHSVATSIRWVSNVHLSYKRRHQAKRTPNPSKEVLETLLLEVLREVLREPLTVLSLLIHNYDDHIA